MEEIIEQIIEKSTTLCGARKMLCDYIFEVASLAMYMEDLREAYKEGMLLLERMWREKK